MINPPDLDKFQEYRKNKKRSFDRPPSLDDFKFTATKPKAAAGKIEKETPKLSNNKGFYYRYTKNDARGSFEEIKSPPAAPAKATVSSSEKSGAMSKAELQALKNTRPPSSAKPEKNKQANQDKGKGLGGRIRNFYGRGKKSTRILKYVGTVLLVIFIIIIGIFIYFAKDLPSPGKIGNRAVVQSSQIYDRTGEMLLYEIHGEEKRTVISLEEMGDYVKWSTLAAEDKNFYHHLGFSVKGLTRAVFRNLGGDSDLLQGGSTITQQLVKNSLLSPEQTYSRKMKELILSLEMEMKYSKDEILEMYLNEIPYGSSAYGIEAAANTFFEKHAKDLTIGEAALLAALPQAPTYYSPFGSHQDDLKFRQELIIDLMEGEGFITAEQGEAAKAEEMKFTQAQEGIIAPHFVMYVKEKLSEKYGEKIIEQGGLRITTTLDMNLQRIAEQVVPEGIDNYAAQYGASNAALTAVDPRTGQILAMQGSKDYFDMDNDGNVNVAIRDRQPGSSFKPFAYAAAFIKGYNEKTMLFDLRTDFGAGYQPENYDRSYRGPVSMKDALASSLNIPAVKTLYLAGVNETIDLAHKMGITTLNEPDRYGLSLVLGGGEVKLLDEVGAYGVFANDGVKKEKTAILKVEQNGEILEEYSSAAGERVLDEQIARQINDILADNNARASVFGSMLSVPGQTVAVKTGTTDEYRDAWTVGYTPHLAAGVWTGNNDNAAMTSGAAGVMVAAPIWKSFMEQALGMEGYSGGEFAKPDAINVNKTMVGGSIAQEEVVKVCRPSMKLATDRCPASMVEEKKYRNVHAILYYVNKDEPLGPYPSNPAVDPQFDKWEGPVQGWADSQGYSREAPPKDYDDQHNADKQPQVSIKSPASGTTIEGGEVMIEVSATAPLGIKNVNFFIDGVMYYSDTAAPYSFGYDFSNLPNGQVIITVEAWDTVDNMGKASTSVNLKNPDYVNVSLNPPPGALSKSQFPISLVAQAESGTGIRNVQFFYENSSGQSTLIGSDSTKDSGGYVTTWNFPGAGLYYLYVLATSEGGATEYSNRATVNVSN